jgi:transaldolase
MPALMSLDALRIQLFTDAADLEAIRLYAKNPRITGFTTNPTLMRKAGIADYERFAKDVLALVEGRPVSFEVFADDFSEMERQARLIASWAPNVFVKIPVTNTKGETAVGTVEKLSGEGIHLNVTAVLTLAQVSEMTQALAKGPRSFVSIFAGRIADTGRDPVPMVADAVRILKAAPKAELIWASPRELLNIFQADQVGCHVITATHDILAKLPLVGKDLTRYSLETVEMFFRDGQAAKYVL